MTLNPIRLKGQSAIEMSSIYDDLHNKTENARIPLDLPREMWRTPLCFMLCLSLLGLYFYPILLVIAILLIKAWKNDRYDLAIMTFLLFGGFAVFSDKVLPVKIYDIGLVVGFICLFFLKKRGPLRKLTIIFVIYSIGIIYLATKSSESIKIQFYVMRQYFSFISLFIPIAIFGNHRFDIMVFMRKFMVYLLIMSVFYIIDAFILKGYIFVPGSHNWTDEISTFYHPILEPFRIIPERKYPQGMIIIGVAILAIARYFRLNRWYIFILGAAAMATQTFSVIVAILVCIILFQGSKKQIMRFAVISASLMLLAVAVDCMLPMRNNDESQLRIRSSFMQFYELSQMVDDEDLAQFGSGRLAQALPILELITDDNKKWTGLGFIHPEKTTATRFIIENEYFSDVTQAVKIATEVEIAQVQVFIHIGYLGLILFTSFFIAMYFVVRKMRYRAVFMAAALFCFLTGLAGFATSYTYAGMSIITFSLAVVLLADKQERKDEEEKEARERKVSEPDYKILLH